ncbi:nucleotidyltransferase [Actinorhabdospora filicis]|uniref:Nucleotidyltransferase n=1 Tax=Actinorhabdospora filicis TaxID=1785913 RepID=A0A9W6SH35_9ACTN|nr:nucleotidyltransferase domain-containing protein [Actinorhabdospora filicis]GLZ75316.1 nucleotidyltransferase [Actinorhabdospora filicis]
MTSIDPHGLVAGHTVYRCVVGSRAYGLARDGSDIDERGVYLAPTPLFWGFDKPPTHVDGPSSPGAELFSWELERLCELALAANPTVLECLWSPLRVMVTPVGEELLELRRAFLSLRVADTYGLYAKAQLRKLTARYQRTGEVRWKQAMHMLRLLRAAAHVLETGEVLVDVSDERELLLAVRDGEVAWAEFDALAAGLRGRVDAAVVGSGLPEVPDRGRVEKFLIAVRGSAV